MKQAMWASVEILAVAILLEACAGPVRNEPGPAGRMVDLMDFLPRARVRTPGPDHFGLVRLRVAGENRYSLYTHPPCRLEYPAFPLAQGSRLLFSIGVNETAWDKGGDGVEFRLLARPSGGEETRIYTRYVDPKHDPRDRRWIEEQVSLDAFAGRSVELTFETSAGPAGNLSFDWAGWGRPILEVGAAD